MRRITDRQGEILRFIIAYIEANNCPPKVRTLMSAFGIGTLAGAVGHLDALERKGHIVSDARPRTSYRVVRDEEGEPVELRFVRSK